MGHDVSIIDQLGRLCRAASTVGPARLQARYERSDDGLSGWAVAGQAARDLDASTESLDVLITVPVKVLTMCAANLGTLGLLLRADPPPKVGYGAIGRSIVEGCSTVPWILSDEVSTEVRRRRAWLNWMCAEGQAARTAAADIRGTGAMEGSPQRLAKMVEQAERCTGNTLVRRSSTDRELQPHEWRLGGERLPSKTELIEQALRRWFPNAVGRVYYGQVSRPAHIDPLVAHAFVDRNLVVASSENAAGNAISALGMWGSAWYYLLSYMGLRDSVFDQWRRRAFAVARSDRSDRNDRPDRSDRSDRVDA